MFIVNNSGNKNENAIDFNRNELDKIDSNSFLYYSSKIIGSLVNSYRSFSTLALIYLMPAFSMVP
jgi:hypothetical protein